MKNIIPLFLSLLLTLYVQAQPSTGLSFQALDSIVSDCYQKGAFAQMIPYTEQAQQKAKKAFGELDSVYALYTGNLGQLYANMGDYPKAEVYLQEALGIKQQLFGKWHGQYAATLNNLGFLYFQWGRYEEAEPFFVETKEIDKKTLGPQSPLFATTLNNLAALYKNIGRYEEAEPLYLQATDIREKALGKNDPYYAQSLNNLASLYEMTNHPQRAVNNYVKAAEIYKETVGVAHQAYSVCVANLGGLYMKMEAYDKAEALYLEAKNNYVQYLGKTHPYYAQVLNNLGTLYEAKEAYGKAEQYYLEALSIRRLKFGEENAMYALSAANQASVYCQMGKLDTALRYAQVALAANSPEIDSLPPAWEQLNELAFYDFLASDRILARFSEIFDAYYQKTKDIKWLQKRYAVTQAAIGLNERIRNAFKSNEDKLRNLASNSYHTEVAVLTANQLNKAPEEMFQIVEANKGVLLMNAVKNSRVYQFGYLPDSLIKQEKKLQKEKSQLKAALAEKRSDKERLELREQQNAVNEAIDQFTKTIKKEYPKYAQMKYEQPTMDASQLQASLDAKTMIVEYLVTDSILMVFGISKQTIIMEPIAVNKKILSNKVAKLRHALSDYVHLSRKPKAAYQEFTTQAYWFYKQTLAPILKQKEIEHLVIIPDGQLGHLPFEAFLVEQAPQSQASYKELHYLLQDYAISYNYSAALWQENKQKAKQTKNSQVLGIAANYNTQLDSNLQNQRLPAYQKMRAHLAPLPAAREEIALLEESYAGFFAFDKEASESVFKAKAADYGIIHLAMHGLLDKEEPILSSLAFTEDSDSSQNNFLHAYEISKMELNASLVVLSACETGYGKFQQGNGIASLARSFMYAGVPALVVSLWQVNDRATAVVMKNFYQNLAQGIPKNKALQQAKLVYMKSAKGVALHPAFWSPFVLIGDSTPVALDTNTIQYYSFIWLGVGLVILLGIGGWLYARNKAA